MCAPCKPIINDLAAAFQAASHSMATALIKFMRWSREGGEPPYGEVADEGPAADALYRQAVADIEAIEETRKRLREGAKVVGASPRWVDLMERL